MARQSLRSRSDARSVPQPPDEDFGALVLEIVDAIPPGRVLSYGDIAAMLGTRAARAVGTVMARSGGVHPWWRVVRSGGHPPRGLENEARPHYDAESTPLVSTSSAWGYRVDYALAEWPASR